MLAQGETLQYRRTEEEEVEDWTAEELGAMQARLEAMQTELEGHLQSTIQSAKTVDPDEPIGVLSRMDAIQQQKMAAANRRSAERFN